MKPLSKGDTCKVRLHTGEVVDAVYDRACVTEKHHSVFVNGQFLIAGSIKRFAHCRFVGPACDLVDIVPVGVSV